MTDALIAEVSATLISGWLKSDSCSCLFPRSIFKRITLTTFLKIDRITSLLEGAFEEAALEQKFSLVILPKVESPDSLAGLLARLTQEPRWTCREVAEVEEFFSLEVLWKTPSGIPSSALGFGPFGFMPVTRRAPLTCLGLWPCEHANAYRKKKHLNEVGIGDTKHNLEESVYKSTMAKTRHNTGRVREAFQLPATLGRTTFHLPKSYREMFQYLKPGNP